MALSQLSLQLGFAHHSSVIWISPGAYGLLTNILLSIKLAFKSLFLHKLRSALTVLGILIGVTAVIWLVAMGEGVSYEAQQQIKNLGATNIIIRSIKPTTMRGDRGQSFFVEYGLLREDFQRIKSSIPSLVQALRFEKSANSAIQNKTT